MRSIFIILSFISISGFAQTASEEFYDQLNTERGKRHELSVDSLLARSAKAWVVKLRSQKMHHDYSGTFGEVLVQNSASPFLSWMHSAPHKKTILNKKYRFVGYYYDKESGIACARFR